MAEQSNPLPNWIAAWNEAQKGLWKSWLSLVRPGPAATAGSTPAATAPGWQQGFDLWRRMVLPVADPATAELSRRLVEQWTAYLHWGQSLMPGAVMPGAPRPSAQSGGATAPWGTDWAAYWGQLFPTAGGATPSGAWGQTDAMRGLMASLQLPLEMCRRAMASLSAFPGGALAGSREGAGPFDLAAVGQTPLDSLLTTPPLGYTREHQERGQKATQDWLAFQKALGVYMGVLTRIATRTAEEIQRRSAERARSGQPVEGLRQVYDFFVDCAEDAYAEVVTAADFGKVSADLMNAAMAVKRHAQAMADEMATAANLPTRRELDTSHQQLLQVKRKLQAMQDELQLRSAAAPAAADASAVEALEREVQALRSEVAELKALRSAPPKPAAAKGRQASDEKVEG